MLFKKSKKDRKESRTSARADFSQASYFRIEDEDDTARVCECLCYDISLGGMAFDTTSCQIIPESEINVLYKIGYKYRNDKLSVKYAKKTATRWRYGCKFETDDEKRDILIKNYITEKKGADS